MHILRTLLLFILVLCIVPFGCNQPQGVGSTNSDNARINKDEYWEMPSTNVGGKGALLLTRFKSYEEFKTVIQISYSGGHRDSNSMIGGKPEVLITHRSGGRQISSVLGPGITQADFLQARTGEFWDRARIVLISPFSVMHRRDLVGIEILARRRNGMFGEGDIAFFDLAETMVFHIIDDDIMFMSSEDLSEKGYLNTFNHITAQALMTSIFSERMADFISDVHERYHMPELITGVFTEDQLLDLEDGPLDNYLDMINNEWGQELGKELRTKYHITRNTHWTPELLANYLNDIQLYYSWAFQIGFKPFRVSDDLVIRFSHKINRVLHDFPALTKDY